MFTELFYGVSEEWAKSWSHTFSVTKLKTLFKKLSTVHPKTLTRRRKRRRKKKTIAKRFALHAIAIMKMFPLEQLLFIFGINLEENQKINFKSHSNTVKNAVTFPHDSVDFISFNYFVLNFAMKLKDTNYKVNEIF